jgi:hypothetical protein
VWLTVLFLATMRSPFLPTYGAFPSLWLATLVIAAHGDRPAIARAAAGIGLLLSISWGIGYLPPLANGSWTTAQTIAAFALVAMACRTLREPATADRRAPTSSAFASA